MSNEAKKKSRKNWTDVELEEIHQHLLGKKSCEWLAEKYRVSIGSIYNTINYYRLRTRSPKRRLKGENGAWEISPETDEVLKDFYSVLAKNKERREVPQPEQSSFARLHGKG